MGTSKSLVHHVRSMKEYGKQEQTYPQALTFHDLGMSVTMPLCKAIRRHWLTDVCYYGEITTRIASFIIILALVVWGLPYNVASKILHANWHLGISGGIPWGAGAEETMVARRNNPQAGGSPYVYQIHRH